MKDLKHKEFEQKPETVRIVVEDNENKNIVKKEFDREYFKPDDDWKPEVIELSDSEDDSKEIENFLEKVVKEHKREGTNMNKGDMDKGNKTYFKRDEMVKEEEEYGEINN